VAVNEQSTKAFLLSEEVTCRADKHVVVDRHANRRVRGQVGFHPLGAFIGPLPLKRIPLTAFPWALSDARGPKSRMIRRIFRSPIGPPSRGKGAGTKLSRNRLITRGFGTLQSGPAGAVTMAQPARVVPFPAMATLRGNGPRCFCWALS